MTAVQITILKDNQSQRTLVYSCSSNEGVQGVEGLLELCPNSPCTHVHCSQYC